MTPPLTALPSRHYHYAMSDELAEVVRELLDRVPASDRALALAAGVPQSTVSRIRTGERGCTPEVARALADALARWSVDCREASDALRRALEDGEDSDE